MSRVDGLGLDRYRPGEARPTSGGQGGAPRLGRLRQAEVANADRTGILTKQTGCERANIQTRLTGCEGMETKPESILRKKSEE